MHIVSGEGASLHLQKTRTYDDTRRDRCDRQGVQGEGHRGAAPGELAAGDGKVTVHDSE